MEIIKDELQTILAGVRNKELGEKEALGLIIVVLMPQIGGKLDYVIDLVQDGVISPEEGADDILISPIG